jgi:AcrR family transcriptional regulator
MARRAPANTKSVLLACARACFVERGVDATTVEAITSRAGVAKGAFYSYFESKDACWRDVLQAFVDELQASMVREPTPADRPLAEGLADDLVRTVHLLEFCWENRAFVRMILAGGATLAHASLVAELGRAARRRSVALRREAVANGVGRADLDATVVATFVAGGYEALVRELIERPRKPNLAEWCRVAEQTWQCGFLTPTARAALPADHRAGPPPRPRRSKALPKR